MHALIETFKQQQTRSIQGVLGEEAQAQLVITSLLPFETTYKLNQANELFTLPLKDLIFLEKINPKHTVCLSAQEVDRPILIEWIRGYEIEVLGSERSDAFEQHIEKRVDIIQADPDCVVLLYENTPVSYCDFNAKLPDIVQIGPVWTPVEHRNKGFARLIIAEAHKRMHNKGIQKSVLFIDTPAAAKAYKVVGFKPIGHYRAALLKG